MIISVYDLDYHDNSRLHKEWLPISIVILRVSWFLVNYHDIQGLPNALLFFLYMCTKQVD